MRALILVLLVTSCGITDQGDDYRNSRYVDQPQKVVANDPPLTGIEELDEWITIFYKEALAAKKPVNDKVTLRFAEEVEFEGSVVGTCVWFSVGQNVKLRKAWWDEESRCMRGMLVIHELGHCALNLDHSEDGIMKPYLPVDCSGDDAEKALIAMLEGMK